MAKRCLHRVRAYGTRQRHTPSCAARSPCVFFAAHGTDEFCRVPVVSHTANTGTHGELSVSGSECSNKLMFIIKGVMAS